MKELVIKTLEKATGLKKSEIENLIEIPPNPELGDYAFPCFIISKREKAAPDKIARDLASKIKSSDFESVKATGPYVNFFLDKKAFAKSVLSKALKKTFGKGSEKGKIGLEHTSINPNASPHIGRSRNAFLGDSIKRLLEFQGHKVETYYYVNDVSKQIALIALYFKGKETFSDLLSLYVKANKKLESSPEIEKKVFSLLEKFESNDPKTNKLFKKIVDTAIKGQEKILSALEINFDKFDYESSYIKSADSIIEKFKKTGKLFEDDQGRLVLDQSGFGLEEKMKSPVLVIARSNGTGLYPLRDASYTIEKMKRAKTNLIVLGEDQKLYFEQINAALKMIGEKAPEVIHYSYVLIQEQGKIGKMSTRRGDVVLLEDFMKQAEKKASEEIKKRETQGDPKKVAYGAVKYALLKNDPMKNILFNLSDSLKFEGDTGPYLQYSYARAKSIIRKSKVKSLVSIKEISVSEFELLKKINSFPNIAKQAAESRNPSLIAHYSFSLAQGFNEFYHASKVIGSDEEAFKLSLVAAFAQTLKNSLSLLGIPVLEKM
tara:strand:- start:196 stop:1833 length:1638 start_codon:yes stop_codon:yes gene_type:complete